jgi:hypothetical protein
MSIATEQTTEIALRTAMDLVVERVPRYVSDRPGLLTTTAEIKVIAGPDDKILAGNYARDVQAEIKARKEFYELACKKTDELHSRVVALRDGPIKVLKAEMDRLSGMCLTYDQEQARLRKIEEERLAAEARRKQQEEQARIAEAARIERERIAEAARIERERIAEAARIERERIEHEAQERAAKLESEGKAKAAAAEIERAAAASRAEAERAAAASKAEAERAEREALAVQEQAEREVLDVEAEIVVMPPEPEPVKVAGIGSRKYYEPVYGEIKALVAAAAQNPDAYLQYLAFNERAVKAAVDAQKLAFRCPGVTVKETAKPTTRASK